MAPGGGTNTPTPAADIDAVVNLAARLPAAERERLADALGELSAGEAARRPAMAAVADRIRARLAEDDARQAAESRLLAKLDAAGQLRPSYLVKTLKDGRLGLFEAALARLGGYERRDVKAAVTSPDRPELLALALAGIGMDRSAFPSILALARGLADGRPGGGERGARRALGAFGPFAREVAATAFRNASRPS
ncbi:MAG: DUF2336 domain-containing protein [Caulobacteraceae bacterium]